MERVATSVEGFDDALGGGVPRGSVVLVCGAPGTMKTSLVFSVLYNNVQKGGSKGLFVSLEQSYEDIKTAMEELGMTGLDDIPLYILDVGKIRREHREEEPEKDWTQVLMEYIDKRVKAHDFDLIAIDSLSGLYSLSELKNPRRDLFHLFSFLKELGATCFLVSEVPYGSPHLSRYEEDFLADGVVLLKHFEVGGGRVQLRIRCVKLRMTRHEHDYFNLILEGSRFMVTPVISEQEMVPASGGRPPPP